MTKLKPPFQVNGEVSSIERAARFVSLIPFKQDGESFNNLPDVFETCQEFLDLRGGDGEEHAILLCNYFNFIDEELGFKNHKSMLLLGKAIPEGNSFYVLRLNTETKKAEIWNPCTGECYSMPTRVSEVRFLCCVVGTSKQTILSGPD